MLRGKSECFHVCGLWVEVISFISAVLVKIVLAEKSFKKNDNI